MNKNENFLLLLIACICSVVRGGYCGSETICNWDDCVEVDTYYGNCIQWTTYGTNCLNICYGNVNGYCDENTCSGCNMMKFDIKFEFSSCFSFNHGCVAICLFNQRDSCFVGWDRPSKSTSLSFMLQSFPHSWRRICEPALLTTTTFKLPSKSL